MRKTFIRFFTIADYLDEECWLRQQHQRGWKLVRVKLPCFYIFESCAPQDVIYRLDYKNGEQTEEYMQLLQDFGWEYFAKFVGWLYFRKPADAVAEEGEDELFSDNASRLQMVQKIVRTRLLPITGLCLCCVLPNFLNAIDGRLSVCSGFFTVFFGVAFLLDLCLILHCGFKLKRIRDKYKD